MVTNKAFTIRLGQTRPWTSSALAQNWYQYHLNLRLKAFFEKFFGDKFFQNRGISFSHVLPRFFSTHANLEVFLHDSKLYDFFSTKPVRRGLRIFKSKKRLKRFFKKFKSFKKYIRLKSKKGRNSPKFFKFKRGTQSRFLVSAGVPTFFRKNLFFGRSSLIRPRFKNLSFQTLESKLKKNKYFKRRFKNVRKFVKSARKLRRRFSRNKFKFFKTVKLKRSNRTFTNSKLNFLLNRRKYLSSIFLTKRRFKRKKFKRKKFRKFRFTRRRRGFRSKKNLFFKKKRLRKRNKLVKIAIKKNYSRKLAKISRKFFTRFHFKLRRAKIRLLKFYILKSRGSPLTRKKFASKLRSYYFKKKRAIFFNLRNKKILNFNRLRRSKLGRNFFRLYKLKKKKKNFVKAKFARKNRRYPYRLKHNKPFRRFGSFSKTRRIFRYPFWRIRFLPITETGRRASRFVFFNPMSAFASNRFIRYDFYHFLGKFLSSQVFKQLNIPVFIKFNFFPLHRAGSDFYLNFITTKLYYRYILSDVIKPIVRISLKFYRGFVINCNGRFTRAQMAVSKRFVRKSVSYSKVTSSLDYSQRSVVLKYGTCNLRIWIRR